MVKNNQGSMQFVMIAIMLVFLVSGLGVWSLMRSWRLNVQTQLRLNRCVASEALALKRQLNLIETTNFGIQAIRLAIRAAEAGLQYELIPPLIEGSTGITLLQEASMKHWEIRVVAWPIKKCGQWRDQVQPLPDLKKYLSRDLADSAGPHPLNWRVGSRHEFKIQATHRSRGIAARVEVQQKSPLRPVHWSAQWTSIH